VKTNIKRAGDSAVLVLLAILVGLWPASVVVHADAVINEYALPSSNATPGDIVQGSDGALWFTELQSNAIGRIDSNGTVTEYPLPTANAGPLGIAAGPDGALWFTEQSVNKIGRITTSGIISEYVVPIPNSSPAHITAGPDDAMWFTQTNAYSVGRIGMDGTVTEYAATGQGNGIALGADNALWITSSGSNLIGRLTTEGSFTTYSIPSPSSNPVRIASGADGALWFTEYANGLGNKVGRITTSGAITEYALPASATGPYAITGATDGNTIWLSAISGNELISIAPDGTMTVHNIPSLQSGPTGITSAADGAVWFTERNVGKIGRLSRAAVVLPDATTLTVTPTNSDNAVGTTATFAATGLRSDGGPATGITVRFAVTGTTSLNGSCITNVTGSCSFSYTGPQLPGADAISIFADNNNNGVQDAGEPTASATQSWLLLQSTSGHVNGGGHISDPYGSAELAFGFTAKSTSSGTVGRCEVINTPADTDIKCIDVTSISANGSSATIFGNATINGVATVYRIDVTDSSNPGTGADTFSIQTASGYYATGTLTGGNITVH